MRFSPVVAILITFLVVSRVIAQSSLPDGEGRDIVEDVCSTCHDLINITESRRTAEQWQYTVSQMIMQGAPLEDYEIETVVDYLTKNFGEGSNLLEDK